MTVELIDMEVYMVDEDLSIKNAGPCHGHSCGCTIELDVTSPKKIEILVITKISSFHMIYDLSPLRAKLNDDPLDMELIKSLHTSTDLTVYRTSMLHHRNMPEKEYCFTQIYSATLNIDTKSTVSFRSTIHDGFLSTYPTIYINPEEKYYKVQNKGRLRMRVVTPILNSDKLQFMDKGEMYAGVGDDPSIVDSSDSDDYTSSKEDTEEEDTEEEED
ncbi:m63R [Myxoma virus]|uniref:M63R n=1 Tax=Myxoma virus TaxID=10273 RepID=B2CWH0_9POXV|nr:m63R [Myxoma virus]ACB28858.1 m63R [recombinant virus 6918VP60-T2]